MQGGGMSTLSNKGMNLTRSAPAKGTAALAGYPRCSPGTGGARGKRSGYNLARCGSRSSWHRRP